MYYAVVYYPNIKHEGFLAFRDKYEPYANLLPPHVSLVYPVDVSIGHKNLSDHIRKVLESWQPFDLHFQSQLELSWDNWMKLLAEEGHEQLVRLHDHLYTGILKPHLRKDLPYNAYIGIGLFSHEHYDFNNITAKTTLDQDKYEQAKREFEALHFDFWCTVDQLTMVKVNSDFTQCDDVEVYKI